ncbi:glutamate ligase domain-containing protein [Homoserinimonas sp. A520]
MRVYGAAGKTTTRLMVDAITETAGSETPADVVVLLSRDEAGRSAVAGLGAGGHVVANADSVPATQLPASAVTFGLGGNAALQASDLDATIDGTSFTLAGDGRRHRVQLKALGEHHVMNALAALAVAAVLGIPLERSIPALERLGTLGSGRMEKLSAPDQVIVIDDSVSSSPQSAAAALKALAQVSAGGRSIAVLGELTLEGEDAREAHDRIGRLIVRLNIKKLIVVGQGARHIHNAAGLEGSWDGESVLVDTAGQAYDLLRDELRKQDVVLVKGAALDRFAQRLTGEAS